MAQRLSRHKGTYEAVANIRQAGIMLNLRLTDFISPGHIYGILQVLGYAPRPLTQPKALLAHDKIINRECTNDKNKFYIFRAMRRRRRASFRA
ncbi:hypothetical protein METHB2_60029 [Candidatus Methylobacter favarea]|uniref:Uncharacterized protein n=1 Tax=Candidatus Methylobacter favarea TaxID=2707345 RepID=A0A8S0YAL0_9GAMM|nr:hypothetical protein METHB2_60029 [Candidatus Methylobacter favarea]